MTHVFFFFSGYGDHRDLPVLTHSFPTRRSSDLRPARLEGAARVLLGVVENAARRDGADPALRQLKRPDRPLVVDGHLALGVDDGAELDRKSTRLNSSH